MGERVREKGGGWIDGWMEAGEGGRESGGRDTMRWRDQERAR